MTKKKSNNSATFLITGVVIILAAIFLAVAFRPTPAATVEAAQPAGQVPEGDRAHKVRNDNRRNPQYRSHLLRSCSIFTFDLYLPAAHPSRTRFLTIRKLGVI